MKTLKVNDGIMGNKFVFIMYQKKPSSITQVSDSVLIDQQNQAIVHIMG